MKRRSVLFSVLALLMGMNVFAQSASETTITTTTTPVTTEPVTTTVVPATTTTSTTIVPSSTSTSTSATGTAVVVERPMIVTTVPAPKEVIVTPAGYANCFTVKAGWYQDVWVADHNVCQYPNSPEGVVWVEGYWTCTKYDVAEGKCTNWDWKSAHWEKTLVVY